MRDLDCQAARYGLSQAQIIVIIRISALSRGSSENSVLINFQSVFKF